MAAHDLLQIQGQNQGLRVLLLRGSGVHIQGFRILDIEHEQLWEHMVLVGRVLVGKGQADRELGRKGLGGKELGDKEHKGLVDKGLGGRG